VYQKGVSVPEWLVFVIKNRSTIHKKDSLPIFMNELQH